MLRRTFALMLSVVMMLAALGLHVVKAQSSTDAKAIEKTRAKVRKLGVGREARVEGRLRDNTRFKGHISAANQDSFAVIDAKTGAEQTITYADVTQVKKRGSGFSTRNWVIVGAAVAATVIVGLTVIKPILCDGC
ncbi:MAG: hypothetical protein JWM21_4319 [Acidobacteria bacterium]|nr:hypothetical protein [Acidobacteriota bacterium]